LEVNLETIFRTKVSLV